MYYSETLDKKKIGEMLKQRIEDYYGKITEYARQTGQVYQTVQSWTNGERLPVLGDMVANCNILDLPLEYTFIGPNLTCKYEEPILNLADEYRVKARHKYPNLIVQDIALIMPLLDARYFFDIISRAGDCDDSFYVFHLFKRHIRTDTDAWKHCIYILQYRNSPLVADIEKIEADDNEIARWQEAYDKKKYKYAECVRKVFSSINMLEGIEKKFPEE